MSDIEPGWWFPTDETGREQLKDPLEGLFGSRSELDSVDILVREALQNSLDALGGAAPPARVRFRIRTLAGTEKQTFVSALDFGVLGRHVTASNEVLAGQSGRYADPSAIDGESPITVLYIEDYGTQGLAGREFKSDLTTANADSPDCFLGLCRSVGRNDKGAAGSGGTYGFGKGVYWAASSIGTAVFHSRLRDAWTPASDDLLNGEQLEPVRERLLGLAHLVSHRVDGIDRMSEGYLCAGRIPGRGPRSFWNDSARSFAKRLGMQVRDESTSGTSIMVVPARDPDTDSSRATLLADAADLAAAIDKAAAHYFWPAVLRGQLQVEVVHGDDPPTMVDPRSRPELRPFLAAFEAVGAGQSGDGVVTAEKSLEVPGWGDLSLSPATAQFSVGVRPSDEPDSSATFEKGPGCNRIALIRGALMVVGYMEKRRRASSARSFHAVVVAGLARGTAEGDEALERLLQRAEPVTHDQWDPKSEQLKGWHGAQARVSRLLEMIQAAVKEITEAAERPTGVGPESLRKMLSLGGSGAQSPSERFGKVEFQKPVEHISGDEGLWLARDIKVRFPAPGRRTDRPLRARVVASIGVRDKEDATRRASDEIVRTLVESFEAKGIAPSAITTELLGDGSAAAIVDLSQAPGAVELSARIRSEAMEPSKFGRRSFDFRVVVERPTRREANVG